MCFGPQAIAARTEIDQIRNFVPQGQGAEPVLYDIRIAFGDDVDFASQNIAGAELDSDGRGVVIRSIEDYSPASTAGMQPGMRVDAIQGTDTRRERSTGAVLQYRSRCPPPFHIGEPRPDQGSTLTFAFLASVKAIRASRDRRVEGEGGSWEKARVHRSSLPLSVYL